MLSRDLLRSEDETVAERLGRRGVEPELLVRWQALDRDRRAGLNEVERLRQSRNALSKQIGALKRAGGSDAASADVVMAEVGELKTKIAELESRTEAAQLELGELDLAFPNLAHASVPVGADETSNRVERLFGEPRAFGFEPQAHWDLGPALGILDFERGAKVAGARFTAYFGAGARLERALVNFMLDLHTSEHGYTEVLPPFIVNSAALTGTGQLPKFEEDLFKLRGHDYYLIPTAEVPVTNLHRGEILDHGQLPVKYVAYTPCFRAEAGSYGKDVRGLIRQHQFQKVELVHLAAPESSYDSLEELTGHAERVLQLLELPYRVLTLSTGDMGFSAAKTYDIEVWLPGQNAYREISSCSNCEDFQARRSGLRYRPAAGGKPRLLHTLNGSGLAAGRTLVAVLENYQNEDGSITIPKVLARYMGGGGKIEARASGTG